MKYQTIALESFFATIGAIYYVSIIATVIFSHVKITCFFTCEDIMFRAKAHLVFHWCLYDKFRYVTG